MFVLEITGFDCGGSAVLSTIKFIMILLDIIFIIAPIFLIVLLAIDFIKAIIAKEVGEQQKLNSLSIKRLVACVALFCVKPITNTVVNIASKQESNYLACIKIAKETDDLSIYDFEIPEVETEQKDANFKENSMTLTPTPEKSNDSDTSDNTQNNTSSQTPTENGTTEISTEDATKNNATLPEVTQSNTKTKEKYSSSKTTMIVTEKQINGHTITVFYIKVSSPTQLGQIQAQNIYGTGVEKLSSMVARTNNSSSGKKVILAVTGAFFRTSDGAQNIAAFKNNYGTTDGIVIQNGILVDSNGSKNAWGYEICQDKNGKLFYAPKGESADNLIKSGVVNTYASHEAKGLQDGNLLETGDNDRAYARTYLAMKKPGEYYIIQTGYDATRAETLSYIKNKLKCSFAGSLEQGGAVASITVNGMIKNHTGYPAGIGDAFVITE